MALSPSGTSVESKARRVLFLYPISLIFLRDWEFHGEEERETHRHRDTGKGRKTKTEVGVVREREKEGRRAGAREGRMGRERGTDGHRETQREREPDSYLEASQRWVLAGLAFSWSWRPPEVSLGSFERKPRGTR